MSEPLGDKRKRLDNLLQSTVEEHNQQADELLGVFQRDFPRTCCRNPWGYGDLSVLPW